MPEEIDFLKEIASKLNRKPQIDLETFQKYFWSSFTGEADDKVIDEAKVIWLTRIAGGPGVAVEVVDKGELIATIPPLGGLNGSRAIEAMFADIRHAREMAKRDTDPLDTRYLATLDVINKKYENNYLYEYVGGWAKLYEVIEGRAPTLPDPNRSTTEQFDAEWDE